MRIIGGLAAGRLLKVPEGLGVRPTPDKVKLAVFNSLGAFLDGALGLECLSRGAREMVSIEKSEKHARFFRQNLAASGLPVTAVTLRVQDVFLVFPQLAQSGRQFDLIIADPPYGEKNVGRRSTSLAQLLLDDIVLPGLLAPGGLFVVGHTKRDTLEIPATWKERKDMRHGDTVMRFLERPAANLSTTDPAP